MSGRGQQYKYTGHVINFLRDIGKVYRKLPLLPQDLEIVLLRPANSSANPRLQRQFIREFRVRREAVSVWLEYLRMNHSGYRDIEIDTEVLSQLPDDGTVIDRIATEDIDEPQSNGDTGAEIDADLENLFPEQQELDPLRQQVQESRNPSPNANFPYLSMPSFRSTPISDFNRSPPLLSLAFPTLYPRGEAEFCHPRPRNQCSQLVKSSRPNLVGGQLASLKLTRVG